MLSICSIRYDSSCVGNSPDEFVQIIYQKTQDAWNKGADAVLFPEYLWMCLSSHMNKKNTPHDVADLFWNTIYPKLSSLFLEHSKTVILGSVPRIEHNKLYNTSIIFSENRVTFQDKMALTPWESDFSKGTKIETFTVGDKRCVVLICLDIEMVELATIIKKEIDPHIIFVPSATETPMGVERIARCASARAIELGSVIVTSAICNQPQNDNFLGKNYGRTALYLPALKGLEDCERTQETDISDQDELVTYFTIDDFIFDTAKQETETTNPATISVVKSIAA